MLENVCMRRKSRITDFVTDLEKNMEEAAARKLETEPPGVPCCSHSIQFAVN